MTQPAQEPETATVDRDENIDSDKDVQVRVPAPWQATTLRLTEVAWRASIAETYNVLLSGTGST